MESSNRLFVWLLLLSLLLVRPVQAQPGNGISSPRDNAVVSGVVLIEGTATHTEFLRYELSFFKEFDPLGDWVVFANGDAPVVNGVLAAWDTTIGRDAGAPFYPDGTYRLRLRVVRHDSNYDEYFVLGLSLANEEPTPTPSSTPTLETEALPVPTSAIAIPTDLPTLTPFPSATPRPTAVPGEDDYQPAGPGPESESGSSLFDFEGEFSSDQIKDGLLLGIKIAVGFFAVLVAYVLFRTGMRVLLSQARSFRLPDGWRDWFRR